MGIRLMLGTMLIASFTVSGCLQAKLTRDEVRVVPEKALPVVWSAMARLSPSADNAGNGFAEASYDEKTFEIAVRASLNAADGGRYMAWLVREEPPTIVLLGAFKYERDDSSYSLTYKTGLDLRDHKRLIVTLEPDDDVSTMPSDPVLEGDIVVVR